MPDQAPGREPPIDVRFGGVWDESKSPREVGGHGLTACLNLLYRRLGAVSKRPGSAQAYGSPPGVLGPSTVTPVSGVRWYRAFPTPLTRLVIAAQGALWTGLDPTGGFSQPLSLLQSFPLGQAAQPVGFCSAYDPAVSNGSGSDVLVICGFTGPFAFATGKLVLTGTNLADQTITIQLVMGGSVVNTATYKTLPTDNKASVAAAIVTAINQSGAVTPKGSGWVGTPGLNFLSASVSSVAQDNSSATITIAALVSGTGGNAITFKTTVVGGGFAYAPASGVVTNLAGGGANISAPLKYDGNTVSGLSPYITQAFTGCASWHDHVWFWGDQLNPNTLFASDINQPEGWTFMLANGGGGTSGGYNIGQGDGDPIVRAAMPIGNLLYVFKTSSIYAITGYDFQGGEYQFSVEPAVKGHGTPSKECVAQLRNALVFWDGATFCRLAPGAVEVELISPTIPLTCGKVANGQQNLIRAVAGDFLVQSALRGFYSPPVGPIGLEVLDRMALFAVDVGNGVADTVLAYDDAKTQREGDYAWTMFSGWQVGAWIPFGGGQGASLGSQYAEQKRLFWVTPIANGPLVVNLFGADPAADSGAAIPWLAQTGWVDNGKPAFVRGLSRAFLYAEAVPGVTFSMTVSTMKVMGSDPGLVTRPGIVFPTTIGPAGVESYQVPMAFVKPSAVGNAHLFLLQEQGSTSSYEVSGIALDFLEEAWRP
jgi:hypothetical protein